MRQAYAHLLLLPPRKSSRSNFTIPETKEPIYLKKKGENYSRSTFATWAEFLICFYGENGDQEEFWEICDEYVKGK